ncbi:putative integral membrane protein [Halobacteriovorax marinus SJ]|uniref:Probable membrane transporter protein n=1 Tax=Halobacteriovorax marinus (strain ATCC BAA-682 / DSM 15412 / SJ) TaxID=862908 RepID=E1WYK3_HALMS|nr:TSUP family transporter [Halobacteriovorax marinus]CBW26051.1 putative integral membrane protein [Halobacteriovorax marinus SJ]
MDLTLLDSFLIFIFVSFAGFVDSIAGGGGLITIPTYMALGVPSHLILGTNKLVSTSGSTVAVFRYIKSGVVDFKVIGYGIFLGLIGSSIGANLASYLDKKNMTYILIAVVPIIFILNNFKDRILKHDDFSLTNKQLIIRCSLIGFIIGGYDGFFGPGTGTFLIVAMVLFLNYGLHQASASARMINYTSNISAFIIFLSKGLIAWEVATIAIFASMCGNFLGSSFVVKGNVKVIKTVFNFVLLGLLAKSILDLFS